MFDRVRMAEMNLGMYSDFTYNNRGLLNCGNSIIINNSTSY